MPAGFIRKQLAPNHVTRRESGMTTSNGGPDIESLTAACSYVRQAQMIHCVSLFEQEKNTLINTLKCGVGICFPDERLVFPPHLVIQPGNE